MGNFVKDSNELQSKGYSADYANKVMYLAGKARYGKRKMEEKSIEGRRRKEKERKEREA